MLIVDWHVASWLALGFNSLDELRVAHPKLVVAVAGLWRDAVNAHDNNNSSSSSNSSKSFASTATTPSATTMSSNSSWVAPFWFVQQ